MSPARPRPVFDGRVAPPTFAAIETTMFCNLQCPFCIQFQDGTTVRGPHMPEPTFAAVADRLFPHLDRFQPSVSGEPLMSKGLDQILARAAQSGLRGEYYCNGTLLNDRMIALILPTLGQLSVSFDGATKATFEALRRGASFDKVLGNVRRLLAAAAALPAAERPRLGFACTLQRANIEELPALVDLAADLGLDFLGAAHVMPGTKEMQRQSLAFHRELARACIQAAFARARARGLPFWVAPLDEMITAVAYDADLASPHAHGRTVAEHDGVEIDVPSGEVNQERLRPFPTAPPRGADAAVVAARAARRAEAGNADAGANPVGPIWTCEFLWGKVYVGHEGNATSCCITGMPVIGDLSRQSLDEVWNGDLQRAMRIGLVRREPVPTCRGCRFIREVSDPDEVNRLLGGRAVPDASPPLPRDLRPVRGGVPARAAAIVTTAAAPRLEWPADADAEAYEVQVSADEFRTLVFATPWHALDLTTPEFTLPEWAWTLAPPGQEFAWRALAVLPEHKRIVAHGRFARR